MESISNFGDRVIGSVLMAAIVFMPIGLSAINILAFAGYERISKIVKRANWFLTILIGTTYNCIYADFMMVKDATWDTQLYNSDKHQAIWSGGMNSFLFLLGVGALGLLVLCVTKTKDISPVGNIICFAAMYIGCAELVVYCIQLTRHPECFPLFILPANVIVIVMTIIREKIKEWNEDPEHQKGEYGKSGFMGLMNDLLHDAQTWPLFAIFVMIPLFGILLCIMTLFGQTPDRVIRTWTETADWTLSTKIPPQNLPKDTHYLCTVAAGGHREVVRPVRMGERHGHAIVVNRQLMIANAFENVLEEKTPGFHRALRNFYDKYGFPVADYIRPHKIACDITYFVMKPLEWLFLLVLYTVDANPENRIAVQYLPVKRD